VLAASSGDEALAACRAAAAPPALLITDVVMPGMNGPALGAMLRRSYPALKVLYLSGYADDQVSKNGTLPYGTYFQQKPFALDRLARRVREIIDAPFDPAPAGGSRATGRPTDPAASEAGPSGVPRNWIAERRSRWC
jgi:CheY-like chemotaxis protein